ncbi:NAD(P)H-hydrate dehydratase [Atopococcus tabaci]|uniref:NAD(P)H-hydrate dehydratase n=1 Tax=Atopococcus tabaci TaxID=269774 RepID=UPI00240A1CC2|nr:NAD(P)H-hydrate dehydratase [Atopococcus tabaci]
MKQIKDLFVLHSIPERRADSHKGDYGRVLFIGGNHQMGGAAILASSAAVYSGAGLVTVATDPSNKTALLARLPEAMTLDMYDTDTLQSVMQTVDVVVIGPGLGKTEKEWHVMKTVLETIQPHQHLVIDGDGISLFVKHQATVPDAHVVFTPHPGEWERLSGLSPKEENPEKNKQARNELGAIIVLKKHRTEIYFDEEVWQNTTGTPAQATGGMGDTLAGMIAAFLGQFQAPKKALLSAVYLHSRIAEDLEATQYVTLPTHIIDRIPETMKQYTKRRLPSI